jgi:hypothetical protein
MDFKRLIIILFFLPLFSAKKNIKNKKIITNEKNTTKKTIKINDISQDNYESSKYSFLNILYETHNNIIVNLKIYNGFIDNFYLLKNTQNNKYFVINDNNNTKNFPSNVFNLMSNHNPDNKIFQSSLDENKEDWIFQQMKINNQIINYDGNRLLKNNEKVEIIFKKVINNITVYRIYYIYNGQIEIEEKSSYENHWFQIQIPCLDFKKVHIHNNNFDGGQYLIEYLGLNNKKFNLYKNNEKNPMTINNLDLLVKSNDLKKNQFFSLWENTKQFFMVQPLDNQGNINQSIIINKRQGNWILRYNNLGNNNKKILIIFDLKCLEQTNNYNNSIINSVFPSGFFSTINLIIIKGFRKITNISKSSILTLILMVFLLRLLILILLYFYRRRFNINFYENITNTKDDKMKFIPIIFMEFLIIPTVNLINRNSSIFVMEPFLWIKDFSWGDNINLGWRFFTLNPLAIITATIMMFLNTNDQPNYGDNKLISISKILGIILVSFIFRYFLNPVTAITLMIQAIIGYFFNKYIITNPNIFRKK